MKNKVYQIQIALRHFKPKIWRRVLIPSDVLLADFHLIIQTTMGWTNSHLHQFIKKNACYAPHHEDDEMWDEMDSIDYLKKKIKVSDLLKAEKDKIIYAYDFGDGWEHDVILEKILPLDNTLKYPICLTGKMNCPPEDCGGVWGYEDMLEILKQPDHEEYESFIDWLGAEFNSEHFDIVEINDLLQAENYGSFSF